MTVHTVRIARAPASPANDLPTGLAQASLGFLLAALGPYVLLLAAELHKTREQVGWLSSVFGVGLVVVAVAALVFQQARVAIVLRVAAAAAAAGAGVAAAVPSMWGAAVGVLLIGIGGAGIVLATPALLRGQAVAARLTRVIAASSCASITAPLLVAVVRDMGLPGRLALLAPIPALVVAAASRCAEPSADTGTRPTWTPAASRGAKPPAATGSRASSTSGASRCAEPSVATGTRPTWTPAASRGAKPPAATGSRASSTSGASRCAEPSAETGTRPTWTPAASRGAKPPAATGSRASSTSGASRCAKPSAETGTRPSRTPAAFRSKVLSAATGSRARWIPGAFRSAKPSAATGSRASWGPAASRCAEPSHLDAGTDARRASPRMVASGWLCIVLAVASEFCFTIWGAARLRDSGASATTAAALSAAFLVGMAAGRLAAPRVAARPATVPVACLTAIAGTGIVCLAQDPWPVAVGLAVAGLGIAVLYPITLARLTAAPGLSPSRSAALGALASGTAIIAAPSLLAVVGSAVSLRVGFVLPGVLLVMLLALSRTHRSSPWTVPA